MLGTRRSNPPNTVNPTQETQFTPGPWKIEDSAQHGAEIWGNGIPVATVVYYNSEMRLSNAKLIAAAPSLLEALKLAHHNLPSIPSYAGSEVEAAICAAIKCATGGN